LLLTSFAVTGDLAPVRISVSVRHHTESNYPHEERRSDDGGVACARPRLPGFNFNVEEWFEGDRYETLAICRSLALARAAFAAAIAEKPAGMFMIRQRIRVVKRHPEGDW